MKIAVITDSGTGWSEEQAKEKGLFYLPLQVKCGDEEFLDGIDITVSELYERLRNGEMPTTSMPPLGRVEQLPSAQSFRSASSILIRRSIRRGIWQCVHESWQSRA